MVNGKKYSYLNKIKVIIIVILCVFLIATPIFLYFRITTEGKVAFREAKNIKLAFEMLQIEYYGRGMSVYDASATNGLAAGVQERLEEILEHDCNVSILAYNNKERMVTAFIYTTGNYRVLYRYDAVQGDCYDVDYMIRILKYDGR